MFRRYDWLVLIIFIGLAWYSNSSWMEIAASLAGLVCVWLNAKENIWAYPVGIVNLALFFFIFYDVKLYADAALQVIFLVLSLYGWAVWLTKREGHPVRPTRTMTKTEGIFLFAGMVLVTGIWGYGLSAYTDASIPYADALIASMSIFAQFFLSRKVLENWFIWIAVDVLSVGLYLYKGLPLIAFTYFVFLIICIYGLISWKKELKSIHTKQAA
ncbi:nicotinamide riboside transporter PnuC [Metabacillus sp. GX 13764]|uniref:nicotinamide riboside transporter PnuC n=1 Tax=Metabacillus kandeliae TaxID=2900151 RepID=UPI001E30925C|nr:nicotinamide riboside transporter PnuC [Metabacillus kandeliae]MCD7034289.1 nicotinamide riboside transporter PnuC [Metabacillus kandeliae]